MTFHSGDVILVPFPFTDLSSAKRRPALLLRNLGEFGDWLCLPVTTRGAHRESQPLRAEDFVDGGLAHSSWVRLDRPTLLSESIMLGRAATLKPTTLASIHLSMCRALGCGQYAVMEGTPQAYSVSGQQ
ncbi:MAG: type II toxin-antitoxin system PemK/MazF family toxin [Rhodocyclales bacterium]|nr:type II toxin-antitoxin system PemK/MazF family toxin [Rhodocyclales bacterium]